MRITPSGDKDMNYVSAGFTQISTAAQGVGVHENVVMPEFVADREGYVLVYLSNENQEAVNVHFDDFTIYHGKTNVVSTQDYYPFGLTFNESVRAASTPQRFGFIGKEKDDITKWNDFGARRYMADIGRWSSQDELAEKYVSNSPYVYTLNNPILLIDPDGKDISVSNLSMEHQKQLARFAKTKEGRAFLAQYAVGGKVYNIGGEKFVFDADGAQSRHTIWYQSRGDMKGKSAGRTRTYAYNPKTKKFEWVKSISTSDTRAIASAKNQYYGFNVYIGDDRSGDEALYTIGHESFNHVDPSRKRLDKAFSQYGSGELTEQAGQSSLNVSPEEVLATLIQGSEDGGADHKMFVNGESVNMEQFVKALDEVMGTDKFSKMLEEDKKKSR